MGIQILMQGNYLDDRKPEKPNREFATLIEFEGGEGKCWLKLVNIEDLNFKVNWKSYSLRGYQQGMKVPEECLLDISGAIEHWNWRIPENSSTHFCLTKEERDSNLIGD